MNKTELKSRIHDYALELGFCAVGFCNVSPFTLHTTELNARGDEYGWWRSSLREPMAWANPQAMVPYAKTIIVFAYDYANVAFPSALCEMLGRVYQSRCYLAPPANINAARTALLLDYLRGLGLDAEESAWLPMRSAAVRARVASFGKNCFAYVKGRGSMVVYGAILCSADLCDEDQQRTTQASPDFNCDCPDGCQLCIKACPTAALYAPGRIDPRRCIAFCNWLATGERESESFWYISRELRPLIGSRIHGCDACQEACPKNRSRLKATGWFGERPALPADPFLEQLAGDLNLEGLLHMREGYYERCVRPVMYNYIKDNRLFQRNAAIAMGNSGDDRYLPHLIEELQNPYHLIRSHVVWAIGEIGGNLARHALIAQLQQEQHALVREELELALDICN